MCLVISKRYYKCGRQEQGTVVNKEFSLQMYNVVRTADVHATALSGQDYALNAKRQFD